MEKTLFTAQHIHLTGYKGVAMTSIAQCIHDLGKKMSGSDLSEEFVTQSLLNKLQIKTSVGFSSNNIPAETDLLIYTAAHQGPQNPEVVYAKAKNIKVLSQAEALGQLFNEKEGIAVCGVGGKSTTSAMITWIFSKINIPISFSVGVGNIPGLEKTGQWKNESKFFVAEADEYVIDPNAPHNHETIVPRFSFLQPSVIVCTQLAFDHPDVYRDFEHTQKVFLDFFEQLKPHGHLIINADQQVLVNLAKQLLHERPDISLHSFGKSTSSTIKLNEIFYKEGTLNTSLEVDEKQIPLKLKVPGEHNALNATAACLVAGMNGIPLDKATHALASFQSTQRRFEFKKNVKNVMFYDDYAHHPRELEVVVKTLNIMFPDREVFLAFQPHTFSRTKALFEEFVQSLGQAKHVILTEIFASSREKNDPSVSSKLLAQSIQQQYPDVNVSYIPTLDELVLFCQEKLPSGSVFMTAGAGDIYKIHDKIS